MTNSIPKEYQILTNLNCNLDCSYCYEKKCQKINKIEDIREFLEACFERDKDKDFDVNVTFVGGECLMYPELLALSIDHAKMLCEKYEIGFNGASISTNGTLITTPDVQEFLLKYKHDLHVGLSIDGLKENHDKHRVYKTSRKGSYDDVVAGANWLFENYCPHRIGVKATFTKDTFDDYANSVISLIELGFIDIGANLIFEDTYDQVFGMKVARQLIEVGEYLFKNNLQNKVKVFQLNGFEDIEGMNYQTSLGHGNEGRNACGSTEHMTCLGFDRKIYGCNRFCTMDRDDMHVGILNKGEIVPCNHFLKEQIITQYKALPDECQSCPVAQYCSACVAIPYEYDNDPQKYLDEKRMCGWTYGQTIARMYFANGLRGLKN